MAVFDGRVFSELETELIVKRMLRDALRSTHYKIPEFSIGVFGFFAKHGAYFLSIITGITAVYLAYVQDTSFWILVIPFTLFTILHLSTCHLSLPTVMFIQQGLTLFSLYAAGVVGYRFYPDSITTPCTFVGMVVSWKFLLLCYDITFKTPLYKKFRANPSQLSSIYYEALESDNDCRYLNLFVISLTIASTIGLCFTRLLAVDHSHPVIGFVSLYFYMCFFYWLLREIRGDSIIDEFNVQDFLETKIKYVTLQEA